MARAIFKSWFVDFDPVRAKTQQIKQGMMQQLLTGRVRLVNGEEAS